MSNASHARACAGWLVGATALACISITAQAATRVDLHSQDVKQLNQRYQAAAAQLGAPTNVGARHAELIGMDPESSLRQLAVKQDRDGTRHYRYQQLYRGVPVFGKQIVVSVSASGNIRALFGGMVDGLGGEVVSTKPRISKARALSAAKRAAFGNRLMAMDIQRESTRVMIFAEGKQRARLSYVVEMFADTSKGDQPTRPFVVVDASNGRILKHWDGLTTADGTGPGGNAKTGQYEWGSGGIYGYLDVAQSGTTCMMDNAEVKSVNLNGSTGASTTAYSYTCPRNTYKAINGAYSPINDAHYFGGLIQDMYNTYTGANALTFQLVMRVHYGNSYQNAFWDGITMSFGDGAGTFYPLVSSDVAGHEVSHGYTEQHSGLVYYGQAGGMNEAFSDMGGEATEYFWKGSNDFLVGAEIFKGSGALRYMANPPQDGVSIDTAGDFAGDMDPHFSSGVYNKAFYLLATTSGWDTPKAFKAFARANALYWTPDTNYYEGACGVETAAGDLGYSAAAVMAAFAAVDVACGGGLVDGGVLLNGVPKTGQAVSAPNDLGYTVNVPGGATNLVISLSGGTGDADLYVGRGSPDPADYLCSSLKAGNAESCSFPTPVAGTYFVRVRPYEPVTGLTVQANYQTSGGSNTDGGALTQGVTVRGISKADGSITYHLLVPENASNLTFLVFGGSGHADLSIKLGGVAVDSSFRCTTLRAGNIERCRWMSPTAGTYDVTLTADPSFEGVSLRGDYRLAR